MHFDASLQLDRAPLDARGLRRVLRRQPAPTLRGRRAHLRQRRAPEAQGRAVLPAIRARRRDERSPRAHPGAPALRLTRGGVLELREHGQPTARFGALEPAEPLRAVLEVHAPAFYRQLLRGSLGLAEAHMDGLWSSPDLVALVRLGARNGDALDRPRRWLRPLIGPARRARARAQHDPPQPQADRRPLRPRQRPLRAVPRRADDVLVRPSSHRRRHPRGGAALHKLELVCRKLDLGPRRPPARDRHRLGRARRPRRRASTAAA